MSANHKGGGWQKGRPNLAQRVPLAVRYWAKVDKRGSDECWPWLGAINWDGHGRIWEGAPNKRLRWAHHIAMEFAGITPPKWPMVCDHTCRNRACVNPAHMRIVSQRVNSLENNDSPHAKNARKTHCIRGHEFTPENTKRAVRNGNPVRQCATCLRMHGRNKQARYRQSKQQSSQGIANDR